jgi:hypothetical protein
MTQPTTAPPATKTDTPTHPGEWTLAQIEDKLKRKLPPQLLDTKKQGSTIIYYLSWTTIADILDKYAPGWHWEIESSAVTSDRIFLTGRLSIVTADGVITRSSTGTETLKREKVDRETGETEICEHAYGDPSSNAEAMALRRCAAKFGLGRYLWKQ